MPCPVHIQIVLRTLLFQVCVHKFYLSIYLSIYDSRFAKYNMFTNEKLNIKQINVVTTNMSQNFEIWFSKKCESSWKNLRYLVANEPLLWIKALSWWSEDMDWQHNWSALSLSWLAFFLDSNFKISTCVCGPTIC